MPASMDSKIPIPSHRVIATHGPYKHPLYSAKPTRQQPGTHACVPCCRLPQSLLSLWRLAQTRPVMKDAPLVQARRAMDDATQRWNDIRLQFGSAEQLLLQAVSEVVRHSQHPQGSAASRLRCLSALPDPMFRNAPFAKMQFPGGRPEPAPAVDSPVAEPAVLEGQSSSSSMGFTAPPIRAVSSSSMNMLSEVRAWRSFGVVQSSACVLLLHTSCHMRLP